MEHGPNFEGGQMFNGVDINALADELDGSINPSEPYLRERLNHLHITDPFTQKEIIERVQEEKMRRIIVKPTSKLVDRHVPHHTDLTEQRHDDLHGFWEQAK